MRVNGRMELEKEMDPSLILVVEDTKENGRRTYGMGKEPSMK